MLEPSAQSSCTGGIQAACLLWRLPLENKAHTGWFEQHACFLAISETRNLETLARVAAVVGRIT